MSLREKRRKRRRIRDGYEISSRAIPKNFSGRQTSYLHRKSLFFQRGYTRHGKVRKRSDTYTRQAIKAAINCTLDKSSAIFNAGHPRVTPEYEFIRLGSVHFIHRIRRGFENRAAFGFGIMAYLPLLVSFVSYSPWNPIGSTLASVTPR